MIHWRVQTCIANMVAWFSKSIHRWPTHHNACAQVIRKTTNTYQCTNTIFAGKPIPNCTHKLRRAHKHTHIDSMFWCAYLPTNVVCAYVAKWVQICANHVTSKYIHPCRSSFNVWLFNVTACTGKPWYVGVSKHVSQTWWHDSLNPYTAGRHATMHVHR